MREKSKEETYKVGGRKEAERWKSTYIVHAYMYVCTVYTRTTTP